MAVFSSSAAIPPEPGAQPFRSLVMALVTSGSEGSSVEAEASAVTEDDSVSSEAELVPGEWLRACSKCSLQRNRTSSSFSHGEPSALFILTGLEWVCLPEICLIALNGARLKGCL